MKGLGKKTFYTCQQTMGQVIPGAMNAERATSRFELANSTSMLGTKLKQNSVLEIAEQQVFKDHPQHLYYL